MVGERGVVVIILVPEALGRHPYPLPRYLTNYDLYNDLVGGNGEALDCGLDLLGQVLGHDLGGCVVVDLVLHVLLNQLLDALLHLGRVESRKSNQSYSMVRTCLVPWAIERKCSGIC